MNLRIEKAVPDSGVKRIFAVIERIDTHRKDALHKTHRSAPRGAVFYRRFVCFNLIRLHCANDSQLYQCKSQIIRVFQYSVKNGIIEFKRAVCLLEHLSQSESVQWTKQTD